MMLPNFRFDIYMARIKRENADGRPFCSDKNEKV